MIEVDNIYLKRNSFSKVVKALICMFTRCESFSCFVCATSEVRLETQREFVLRYRRVKSRLFRLVNNTRPDATFTTLSPSLFLNLILQLSITKTHPTRVHRFSRAHKNFSDGEDCIAAQQRLKGCTPTFGLIETFRTIFTCNEVRGETTFLSLKQY